MNAGHDHVGRIETAADDGDLMLVAQRRQASIAAPAVSVDGRSGHGDSLNEGVRLSADTSATWRWRMRPMPRPLFSAATPTMALSSV